MFGIGDSLELFKAQPIAGRRISMLHVHGLHVAYGKIRAVQGISLEVGEGEIVVLIGTNGAGKSSTLNAICGIVRPDQGSVIYNGDEITVLPAHKIARRGLVQVPEGRLIFGALSLEENLRLGAYGVASGAGVAGDMERVMRHFPGLQGRLSERASNLSGGQLQMLALARGLMARPRLLLLDEPSLGLAPLVVREVFRLIRTLRDEGITILLVEQNVRQALAVVDRGYVLESGRIILDGTARELLQNELLVNSYLGILGGEVPR